MDTRRGVAADVPRLTGLVERYWQFEELDGFDPARTAVLLTRLCDGQRATVLQLPANGRPVTTEHAVDAPEHVPAPSLST